MPPFYYSPVLAGTLDIKNVGDGYSITVKWHQAMHSVPAYKLAYHIYFSTVKEAVFSEGVKFVSIDDSLEANILDLIPGQLYFFAVRPVEYDPNQFDLTTLPIAYDNLRYYPSGVLREDITADDLIIPLLDTSDFPSAGIIQIGVELVQYLSIDSGNNNLIVPAPGAETPAHLLDLGGGNYYLPGTDNVGTGVINNLAVSTGPTETWTIRCVGVFRNSSNQPIANTAKFTAIGSISGSPVDGYGNTFIWDVIDNLVNNGILEFSIDETTPFVEGDFFTVKVVSAEAGLSGGRGYNNGVARPHDINGFDGTSYWDPTIYIHTIGESSKFDRIFMCQCRFEYPTYAYTLVDGYKQVIEDLLSTDLSGSDASNVDFPTYDFSGYHRTDPTLIINGTCIGSYIGGERGCIDGYGNYNIIRNLPLQDINTQNQDVLLSLTGREAVLIKRTWTGIPCSCYLASSEYPDDRCPLCNGSKFVIGYEQYFNPRKSNGRIMIRVGPTPEALRMKEAGFDSEFPLDVWTLTVPTIKMRDILILFDETGVNEEFRYEVSDVIRNNTVLSLNGGQHFKMIRIRKFDPAYQIRAFRDTSMFPSKLNTTIGFVAGIPPHVHEITKNEKDPSGWSQTTSVAQGHNHQVIITSGLPDVVDVLGHSHEIILP